MTLEKPFVECYIFYTHNVFVTYFDDLIYKQKRKAMWQFTFDVFEIVNRWFARIVTWNIGLVLVLFNMLFYLLCKLYIAAMTGAAGNNVGFDRISDQCKVTDYVQQFMTCGLIGKT